MHNINKHNRTTTMHNIQITLQNTNIKVWYLNGTQYLDGIYKKAN